MIRQLKDNLKLYLVGSALASALAVSPAYAQTNEGSGEEILTTEDGTGEGSGYFFDSAFTPNPSTSPSVEDDETPVEPVMPAVVETSEFTVPVVEPAPLTEIVEQTVTAPEAVRGIAPTSDSQVIQYNVQIGIINRILGPTGIRVDAADSNVFTGEIDINRSNLFAGEIQIQESNISAGEMRDYVQDRLGNIMGLLTDGYVTRDEFNTIQELLTGILGNLQLLDYRLTLDGQRINHLDQAVIAMNRRAEDMYAHIQGSVGQLREDFSSLEEQLGSFEREVREDLAAQPRVYARIGAGATIGSDGAAPYVAASGCVSGLVSPFDLCGGTAYSPVSQSDSRVVDELVVNGVRRTGTERTTMEDLVPFTAGLCLGDENYGACLRAGVVLGEEARSFNGTVTSDSGLSGQANPEASSQMYGQHVVGLDARACIADFCLGAGVENRGSTGTSVGLFLEATPGRYNNDN